MVFSAAVLSAVVGACALIDERQKECPEEMEMTCTVSLVNNKEEEMNDKLGTLHDLPLRAALEDYLSDVFVDDAHDVEMLFYDQRRRGKMTFRQSEVMDAEQKVFSLQVPASDYRVAAVANLSAVPMLSLQNEEDGYALALTHKSPKGTVPSHPSAVYAARQRMLIRDREDQQFEVRFHMANAAAVVALNCDSCEVRSLRATFSGLADTFRILDSAYSFDQHIEMEADIIDAQPYVDDSEETERFIYDTFWERWTKLPLMVCAVGFPSPSVGSAVTRNEIYIGKPLESSQLLIIKGWLTANGSFMNTPPHPPYVPPPPVDPDQPVDSTVVGVTVMLNWTDGLDQNTNL